MHYTLQKTNMATEHPPFEDVFPIEHGPGGFCPIIMLIFGSVFSYLQTHVLMEPPLWPPRINRSFLSGASGPQQMKQDKVFACHPCYKVWPRCGAYGMLMWFLVPGDSTKWPSEGILVHRWGKWCLIPGDAILTKFRSVRSASSAAGWRRRMARNMLPRRFF